MNGLLIGVLTGLDNLAVSAGFHGAKLPRRSLFVLVTAFALCEALMPLVGFAVAGALPLGWLDEAGPMLLIGAGLLVAWRVLHGAPMIRSAFWLVGIPVLMSLDNMVAGAAMRGFASFDLAAVCLAGLVAATLSLVGLWLGSQIHRVLQPSLPLVAQLTLAIVLIGVGGAELLGA